MRTTLAAAIVCCFVPLHDSIACAAGTTQQEAQDSATVQQWRDFDKAPGFFHKMAVLQHLAQDPHERTAVLARLHKMWTTYDVLRRPEIAYLMCQLGDRSGLETVAIASFAGDYDSGPELEPDGDAAGANATDDAFRMLVLYGTHEHHQKLLAFFKLSDDPLRKRDEFCGILLGLSSTKYGPGLPVGHLKDQFPLELAIACLDYQEEVETLVSAPGGTVETQLNPRQGDSQQGSMTVSSVTDIYEQRGCDEAAQTIQNLTSLDFGHRVNGSISDRDKAIKAIKAWWAKTHPTKDAATPN